MCYMMSGCHGMTSTFLLWRREKSTEQHPMQTSCTQQYRLMREQTISAKHPNKKLVWAPAEMQQHVEKNREVLARSYDQIIVIARFASKTKSTNRIWNGWCCGVLCAVLATLMISLFFSALSFFRLGIVCRIINHCFCRSVVHLSSFPLVLSDNDEC